ncbi:MAG: EamA family transporter, partial [Chloroflexi bacterium]|nr:EamA family transporter [Chloroflexota bacterium]
ALFGAFAGLVLEYWIVHHFGATAAAMTAYVIPIAATLGGTLFLGEQVTGRMLIGMALIILGIAILHRRYPVKEEIIPPLS